MKKYLSIIYLLLFSQISGQEIPNEFYQFQLNKLFLNIGENWKVSSTFNPIRVQQFDNYIYGNDSLKIDFRIGFNGYRKDSNNGIALYSYGHLSFKKYFYAYLYPRIVNNGNLIPRYSGKERYFGRTGETDLAGIGYQNKWILLQWGRGRQSWGAGNNIQLVISENSPSYDYGLLGLNFGYLRVRYFHGFLEENNNNNRYITGRGIEWTNEKFYIISLSEIVIYSGINRPMDIAYLNPISTHLEIEMNDRQNEAGFSSGNGVWQASLDLFLKAFNLRFSGNILFDEFTLDINHELEEGEGHSNAISFKSVWTPEISKNYHTSFFVDYIMVGTHTFRHMNGYNNFVQRGKPLGWQYGSDTDQYRVGINIFNNSNLIGNLLLGVRRSGGETIINNPNEPYHHFKEVPFPSGVVTKTEFLSAEIQFWWKSNILFLVGIDWLDPIKNRQMLSLRLGLDIYYPKSFKI